MNRIRFALLVLAAAMLGSGCSMIAPRYTASLEDVQTIKDAGVQQTRVGTFESTPGKGNANPISLRGSTLDSPYDHSYAKYLAEALTQELSLAGKLAADAKIVVTGALQKNDVNIPPFGNGTGDLEARFIVTRDGAVRYDQVKSIHYEWESSFVGNIAIPRAQQNYPLVVQKLLAQLLLDTDFLQALK